MDTNPGITLLEATKSALSKVDGTYGLAIVSKNSTTDIIAACQGSPMVIGVRTYSFFLSCYALQWL